MVDLATLVDMLVRGGPVELEEIEREISVHEERLRWLKLLRDALVVDGRRLEPRYTGSVPVPADMLERLQTALGGGQWVTVEEAVKLVGGTANGVRYLLDRRSDLFERMTLQKDQRQGKARVVYRRVRQGPASGSGNGEVVS